MKDYYRILDVSNTADNFAIKAAYKRLEYQYNIGLNLDFAEIKDAYSTLIHRPSRISYDLAVKVHNSPYTKKKPSHKFIYDSNIPYAAGVLGTSGDDRMPVESFLDKTISIPLSKTISITFPKIVKWFNIIVIILMLLSAIISKN